MGNNNSTSSGRLDQVGQSKPIVEILPSIAEEDRNPFETSLLEESVEEDTHNGSFSSAIMMTSMARLSSSPAAAEGAVLMESSMTSSSFVSCSGGTETIVAYDYNNTTSQKQRSSIISISPVLPVQSTSGTITAIPAIRNRISPPASASTSFDERFKYKISIYSKVSGCRMTNLPDYTIVKQIRVTILEHITHGNPHEVMGIKFAYEKMKNGGLQVITDDKRLSNALSGLSYFASIPCKMTFPNSPRVVGFVKDLPINMEPAELKCEIRKQLPEVYSVRYITERIGGRSRPSQRPCAFVSFNLRYLPGSIRIFGKEYEIMVPNPMQCTRCCRYGHQGKQCRAEVRCPICGKQHPKQQCESTVFRCVNCKGTHASTSHECLVWQQGKTMNELRYRGGLTAEEAIDVASNGKIQHKKHRFVSPDEYFDNQESYYLGSGDGSADEEVLNSMVNPTMNNDFDANGAHENEESKVLFHPKYVAAQQFLDLATDFYLRLMNPTENYTSSMLMPGFEEESMIQRIRGHKKQSHVAQQFKLSVLQVFEEDRQPQVVSSQSA